MGNWDDIPPALRAGPTDEPVLDLIIKRVREAARVRHDFQTVVSNASGERRLHRPGFESEYAKGVGGKPMLDGLARAHKVYSDSLQSLINMLDNRELAKFLAASIMALFPDIGYNSSGRPLRKLQGPTDVLHLVLPARGDTLVRTLIKRVKSGSGDFYW